MTEPIGRTLECVYALIRVKELEDDNSYMKSLLKELISKPKPPYIKLELWKKLKEAF